MASVLAFVSLAPLLLLIDGGSFKRAASLGYAFGLAGVVTGFSWLSEAYVEFAGVSAGAGLVLLLAFALWHAARFAVLAALASVLLRSSRLFVPSVLVALLATEMWFPVLIPWYLGGAAHPVPELLQVAELGGPAATSIGPLMTSVLVAAVLSRATSSARVIRSLTDALALALCLASTAGYGLLRVAQVSSSLERLETIDVGIVQANVSPKVKRKESALALQKQLRLTGDLLLQAEPDLIIWSETAIAMTLDENTAASWISETFAREVASAGAAMIVGAPVRTEEGKLLNSAFSTDRHGRARSRYDKVQLFPLSETRPEWLPTSLGFADTPRFAAGTRAAPLLVGDGHRAVTLICYEDLFADLTRRAVIETDAEILVSLTNDVWFGRTSEPWIHFALSKLRAIEQRRYLIRAANSGVSAIIDPVGRAARKSEAHVEALLVGPVGFTTSKTFYARHGDLPLKGVTILLGLSLGARQLIENRIGKKRTTKAAEVL